MWDKEKMLFTSSFSFSHIVFKKAVKNTELLDMGLIRI